MKNKFMGERVYKFDLETSEKMGFTHDDLENSTMLDALELSAIVHAVNMLTDDNIKLRTVWMHRNHVLFVLEDEDGEFSYYQNGIAMVKCIFNQHIEDMASAMAKQLFDNS